MKQLKIALTLMLLAGWWTGCGTAVKDDTAELTPAAGVVTLDDKPLPNAMVQFFPPVGSEIQATYHGSTDAEGKFELQNPRGRAGAEPGDFKVVISKFAQKDGTPFAADADSGDFAALGMEHLPPKYSDPDKSELRATVPAEGKTDFEFSLKSK